MVQPLRLTFYFSFNCHVCNMTPTLQRQHVSDFPFTTSPRNRSTDTLLLLQRDCKGSFCTVLWHNNDGMFRVYNSAWFVNYSEETEYYYYYCDRRCTAVNIFHVLQANYNFNKLYNNREFRGPAGVAVSTTASQQEGRGFLPRVGTFSLCL